MESLGERRDKPMIEKRLFEAALKSRYDDVTQKPLPDRFRDLLKQLEAAEARER